MKGSGARRVGGRFSVERRNEILDVALAVLAERGYRAHASKETLYSWFGDKSGLFEQMVSWQAERLDETLARSLEPEGDDARAVLRTFAVEMLRLLLGERRDHKSGRDLRVSSRSCFRTDSDLTG